MRDDYKIIYKRQTKFYARLDTYNVIIQRLNPYWCNTAPNVCKSIAIMSWGETFQIMFSPKCDFKFTVSFYLFNPFLLFPEV